MTNGRRQLIPTTTEKDDSKPRDKQRARSAKSAYDRLIDLLARRDHSERELRTKLSKAEHSEEEVDAAIETARERKWLPDETVLAERESGRLARAGKSPAQIKVWLIKKGLPTSGLKLQEDEVESAYMTASKSWNRLVRTAKRTVLKKSGKLETEVRNRVNRLLMSRGFSGSTARTVYARLLKENPLNIEE